MKRRIGLWAGGVALFTFLMVHYGVQPYLASLSPHLRYGHASDFSWVAGQIFDGNSHGGGCLYIFDNDPTAHPLTHRTGFLPRGQGGRLIYNYLARTGTFVVVFGHLEGPGERDDYARGPLAWHMNHAAHGCGHYPVYIIDRVELVLSSQDQALIAALVGLLAGGLTARLLFLRLHRGHIPAGKIEGVG